MAPSATISAFEGAGLRGIGGGMTSHLSTNVEHMCPRVQKPHKSSFFLGVAFWAGCVLSSKSIDLDRDCFRKLRG
jgi:hypothetical protein